MAERGPTASGGEVGATASGVADQVQEVAGQVQDQAGHLVDQARQAAMSQVTSQKDRAAGGLETAAGLLRGAGEQLRALDQPTVAQYVDSAADRAQQFSDQLRTQDVGQLVEATERFARRQPMLFVGTALTAGFLATRFLRSSGRQQGTETGSYSATGGTRPYGGDVYASGYAGGMSGAPLGYGAALETDIAPGLDDPLLDGSLGGAPTPADYTRGSEER